MNNHNIYKVVDGLILISDLLIAFYEPYQAKKVKKYLLENNQLDEIRIFFLNLEKAFDGDSQMLREFNDLLCRGCLSFLHSPRSIFSKKLSEFATHLIGSKVISFLEENLPDIILIIKNYNKILNINTMDNKNDDIHTHGFYTKVKKEQISAINNRFGGINLRAGYPEIGGVKYKTEFDCNNQKIILRERSLAQGRNYLNIDHLKFLTRSYTNNSGDIRVVPKSSRHFKERELQLIEKIINTYGDDSNNFTGYITVGGTLGNLHSVRVLRDYLKIKSNLHLNLNHFQSYTDLKKLINQNINHLGSRLDSKLVKKQINNNQAALDALDANNPVVFISSAAHYSFDKIITILELEQCKIEANTEDRMSLSDLKKKLDLHMETSPKRPIIMIATIGTTQLSSLDPIDRIKHLLEESGVNYMIHADAAIYGATIKYMEPAPFAQSLFYYCNTLTISNHKILGTIMTTGTVFIEQEIKDTVFRDDSHYKHYVGTLDTTLEGSRTAYFVFEAEMAWNKFLTNPDLIRAMLKGTSEVLYYAKAMLTSILGEENVKYSSHHTGQGNLIFSLVKKDDQLKNKLLQDYGLMPVSTMMQGRMCDQCFGICNMLHVDYFIINSIVDTIYESMYPEKEVKLLSSLVRKRFIDI